MQIEEKQKIQLENAKRQPNKYIRAKIEHAIQRYHLEAPNCPSDWKEDSMYKLWIENKERKRGDEDVTKKVMEMIDFWIPRYLSFHKKSITELIDLAKADPKNHKGADDTSKFKKHALLKFTESSDASIHNGCYSIIRGMYSMLDINTSQWFMPNKPKSRNPAQDLKFPLFNTVRGKAELNKEYLIPWLEKLSERNRVIALCMISTGLDWEDLGLMTIEHVLQQSGQDYLYYNGDRQKAPHSSFVSIFGKEATERVNHFIQYNRKDCKSNDEGVFTDKPLSASAITTAFRKAFDALELPIKKGTHNPFRPKRLRHLYRNTYIKVPADDGVRDAFMGHDKEVAHYYLELPKEDLVELHKQREHLTTVYKEIVSDDDYKEIVLAFQTQNVEYEAAKRDAAAKTKELADFRKKYKKDMKQLFKKTLPPATSENMDPQLMNKIFADVEEYLKKKNKH